ncbi:hypothetical protein BDS110ZK25_75820 [Bradyrhizobium diazoefficiens]
MNEIFSLSEVAGYSATGQVTSERRRKPFQLARGAMNAILQVTVLGLKTNGRLGFRQADKANFGSQQPEPDKAPQPGPYLPKRP